MPFDITRVSETFQPPSSLSRLSDEARALAKKSLSANTRRAYFHQWGLWETWATERGIVTAPADPAGVANWLAERQATGRTGNKRARRVAAGQSRASLGVAVAAIKYVHRSKGLTFRTDDPAIALVLAGATREQVEGDNQAAPLKADMLLDVLKSLGDDPISRRDAAILALGYSCGRRRSEIVGLDLGALGKVEGATGWLERDATKLSIKLAKHKTGKGKVATFVLPRKGNAAAIEAIERWVNLAGICSGKPLFRHIRKGGAITADRLRPRHVSRIVKARVREYLIRNGAPADLAELEAQRYSGHSLRVGLAVTAAEHGADIRVIQAALGHATPTMSARYAEAAEKVRTSPLNIAGVGLDQPNSISTEGNPHD